MAASERPWWFLFTRLARMAARDGLWRAEPGLTASQVLEAGAVFAHMGVSLPEGLLDLYKETAQFGCIRAPDEFFGPVHLRGGLVPIWDRNRDWRRAGIFRVADAGSVALVCDAEGRWSLPGRSGTNCRLTFDDAATRFMQAMIREYGSEKTVLATA